MTGIEPASSAWEADVLPMNYICNIEIISRLWIKVNYKIIKSAIQIYNILLS